jgi:hypothetical protein
MLEKRREGRFACDLSVTVQLREGSNGPVLAGPAPGRLHDISSYGASLIVPQIRFGKHHLFYSSRDQLPDQLLFIDVSAPDDETLSIPVRPIGFDRVLCDETMPFQIGVEFIGNSDAQVARLLTLVRERRGGRKSWWLNLFSRIWPAYETKEE